MNYIVIGANFGDEGKGLLVDYLFNKHHLPVIRFNSHSGAGHTVVDQKTGERRVHTHGSSTFHSDHRVLLGPKFICNPLILSKQEEKFNTRLYTHPRCLVTTPFDMIRNSQRSAENTTGVGLSETVERSIRTPELNIYMGDKGETIRGKFFEIGESAEKQLNLDLLWKDFAKNLVLYYPIHHFTNYRVPEAIYEGAQGLLLSTYSSYFPNVTRCDTGCRDAIELIDRESPIEVIYVMRTYWTRHGNGPFGRRIKPFEDKTNVTNQFQGQMRFARIKLNQMRSAIKLDLDHLSGRDFTLSLAITHLDQTDNKILTEEFGDTSIGQLVSILKNYFPVKKLYISSGETRNNIIEKEIK